MILEVQEDRTRQWGKGHRDSPTTCLRDAMLCPLSQPTRVLGTGSIGGAGSGRYQPRDLREAEEDVALGLRGPCHHR